MMLRVERRALHAREHEHGAHSDVLSLPYDQRKKSRLRAQTERGVDVAIVLERGSVLRDGDLLVADSGEVLLVRAAPELVSDVHTDDARLLARAAYHLGNRHVALQIEAGRLRYQHDHVLDGMVRELGLKVERGMEGFEPEAGAYAVGGHGHGHGHDHDHDHVQDRGQVRRGHGP